MSDNDRLEVYERLRQPVEALTRVDHVDGGVPDLVASIIAQYPVLAEAASKPVYPEDSITPLQPASTNALTSEQMQAQARQIINRIAA